MQGRGVIRGLCVAVEHSRRCHAARIVADIFDSCFVKACKAKCAFNARVLQPYLDLSPERINPIDRLCFELALDSERCPSNDRYEPSMLFYNLTGELCAQGAVSPSDPERQLFDPCDFLWTVGQDTPINVPVCIIQNFSRFITTGVL